MTKTIEFVEKEIEFENKFALKDEEKITALQQIKTILEAWEIVKEYTDTSEDIVNTEYYFIKGLDDEFETLKKALEVKDE